MSDTDTNTNTHSNDSASPNVAMGMLNAGLLLIGLYVWGIIDPEVWWGIHFLAYLPDGWQYALLALGSLLILASSFNRITTISITLPQLLQHRYSATLLILLIGILCGIGFQQLPIVVDNYGDSFLWRDKLDNTITEMPPSMVEELLSFHLRPSHGRNFMLGIINLGALTTGASYRSVFAWMDTLCGVAFVLLWLFYVHRKISASAWKIVLASIGITAPFMQAFFGHIEVYAPVYVLFMGWMILLLRCIDKRQYWLLGLLFLALFLLFRIHPLTVLLIPIWCLALVALLTKGNPKWFNWKVFSLGVLLPIVVVGAVYYFFIGENYKDLRELKNTSDTARLFLPLLSPEPPLDRYNLLGWNHMLDYVNMVLFWSTPALVLLGIIAVYFRKLIQWNKISILFTAFPVIFLLMFLFVFNPLISMPMDWDLFALTVPFLLLLLVALVQQIQFHTNLAKRMLFLLAGLACLNLPIHAINVSKTMYSYRMEDIGIHVFKTYYEWSGKQIDFAWWLLSEDKELYMQRQQKVLQDLKPIAVPGHDEHYAHLLSIHGNQYMQMGNFPQALPYLQEAYSYAPDHKVNRLRLLETNFRLRDFEAAYDHALALVQFHYPNDKRALRMAIHTAVEAGLRDAAYRHAATYLEQWPADSTIQKVQTGIESGASMEALQQLFAQPN